MASGSGKLTWANDDGTGTIPLREGDLCSLSEESVFYIQSNLEAERRKLRIYAIFTNTEDNTFVSVTHVFFFIELTQKFKVCLLLFVLIVNHECRIHQSVLIQESTNWSRALIRKSCKQL